MSDGASGGASDAGRDRSSDRALRDQLLTLLDSAQAHAAFDHVVAGLEPELVGRRPEGFEHSAWELLEHLRIAQRDILEFSRDPEHVSPEWPDGYWPDKPAPAADIRDAADAWADAVAAFRADREAFEDLVRDRRRDLHEPFPWGSGQTLLREALLLADHNAYHLGQLVALRRALGAWPPPEEAGEGDGES